MSERTIEDRLREEYFDHLAEVRRVLSQLETEIRYHSLSILHGLKPYEQLVIRSRIKDCESAVKALRRRQEFDTFDPATPESYSILSLRDLAGVRVLVFPHGKLMEANNALSKHFFGWLPDPVIGDDGGTLAYKYSGVCTEASTKVVAEYQIVPMLIGLFWEVEHSAMYKPVPALKKRIEKSSRMKQLRSNVEVALSQFEEEFENFVLEDTEAAP